MDLFTSMNDTANRAKSSDFIGAWAEHMPADVNALLPDWMDEVYKLYQQHTIYPDYQDIFKPFKLITHPSKVKVVIIGQDPYHNGKATGLSFACKGEDVSPSLIHIVRAMKDNGYPITPLSNPSLEYLAEQGVLLLNTTLTVEEGKPDSHAALFRTGWRWFITGVAKAVSKNKPLIVLAWGNRAKQAVTDFELTANAVRNTDLHILQAEHPASAAYRGGTWNCNHFRTTNDILSLYNQQPIQWL